MRDEQKKKKKKKKKKKGTAYTTNLYILQDGLASALQICKTSVRKRDMSHSIHSAQVVQIFVQSFGEFLQ